KISNERVEKPEDVLKIGDTIKVKVTDVTEKGVSVSAKDLLPKADKKVDTPKSEEKEEPKEKKHFGEVRFFKKKD
ncbi:MAG: S1 RNA-binding domain-containing protein, partial [Erysipelotrichaceae bacterium]|nr:S1 RNA-binding domain-containing protein [Erysipelotrichaceae bacterium]